MKRVLQVVVLMGSLLPLQSGWAAAEYVTDRIMLGVHQEANEDSTLLTSLPSGEQVEVLQESNGFKKIRTKDGQQGWVKAAFLVKSAPATLAYDQLLTKHNKTQEEINKLNEHIAKTERELQVRRDELSNAKTTIRELNKQIAAGGGGSEIDEETLQRLSEKEQEIDQLRAEIEALKQDTEPKPPPNLQEFQQKLTEQKQSNEKLKTRIELAMAYLNGEQVPTPEQLKSWRPPLPGWYWGLLIIAAIVGVVGGISWMDYRLRRRHGGFRI